MKIPFFSRMFQKPRMAYDAAKARRRLSTWKATNASMRTIMQNEGPLMLARCRDVIRNNPYGAGAAEVFKSNLVGVGIKPSSLLTDAPELRQQIMEKWLLWTDEADADGIYDFYGMQTAIGHALFEAGEVFIRRRPRRPEDGLSVPLQYQLIESEQLDHSFTKKADNGNDIVSGVEFDLLGKRVAYHFWREHPGNMSANKMGERVRVPADGVMHVMRATRPGQVRGVPLVTPAVVKLWLLDQYDDAELDRKKTAAMFAGFITSPSPEDVLEDDETSGADASAEAGVVTLEPGTMQTLLPGEEVQFSQPADVGGGYEAFQYRTLLAVFSAMGVPYTIGTGDLKRANYSSLRGAIIEFRRRISQLQHQVIVHQFARRVWADFLDAAVLSGALQIPGYARDPLPYRKVKWIPPKFEWVDPLKDLKAEAVAVQYGFKARSDVIEEFGNDAEETDSRIAADAKRATALGIVISTNPVPLDGEQQADLDAAAQAAADEAAA